VVKTREEERGGGKRRGVVMRERNMAIGEGKG
jgi:hypothetical protein